MTDKIMKRVSARRSGSWVCTPKDFLDLGSRHAVDQALSRLVKAGKLRRIGRGLYAKPRFSKFLNKIVPADLEAVVKAVVKRDGIRLMPTGLAAANGLRLENTVPAKIVYVTDGYSRTLKIDGWMIQFQHAAPSVMKWAGKPSALVVQALRWYGPNLAVNSRIITNLKRRLPDEVKLDLRNNLSDLPGWTLPLVQEITSDHVESD